jgi:hypothetical protein
MGRKGDAISMEMQDVGQRLEEWRTTHAPRRRLPGELWEAAVAVARQEGIYRTARALHLDYANLKRRAQGISRPVITGSSSSTPRRRRTGDTPRTGVSSPKRTRATGVVDGGSKRAEFVELLAGSFGVPDSPPDCLVEVEGGGNRMRIQMKLTATEMMSLVRDWRDGQK